MQSVLKRVLAMVHCLFFFCFPYAPTPFQDDTAHQLLDWTPTHCHRRNLADVSYQWLSPAGDVPSLDASRSGYTVYSDS